MMITRGVDFQNNCAKTLFFQKFTLSLSQEARVDAQFLPLRQPTLLLCNAHKQKRFHVVALRSSPRGSRDSSIRMGCSCRWWWKLQSPAVHKAVKLLDHTVRPEFQRDPVAEVVSFCIIISVIQNTRCRTAGFAQRAAGLVVAGGGQPALPLRRGNECL